MSGQKFCSFLYVAGLGSERDARLLRYLPVDNGQVRLYMLGEARLYVAAAVGNPLHRHIALREAGFDLFLQGEFYEATALEEFANVIIDGNLDVSALAGFVARLNGVFAGFVAGPGPGPVWGFNDRFGMGHVYLTARTGGVIAASSLWPALSGGGHAGRWHPEALQEILMFGYPLREQTPLADTWIVQPGLILRMEPGSVAPMPYHSYDRENILEHRDHIEDFRDAAGEHFASIRRLTGWTGYGSTLSGGHDSRVVINAMMANGIRPNCYVGYDGHPTWDSKRGRLAARAAGLPAVVFDYQDYGEQDWVDANVLADGSGTASWSMNLAKQAAVRDECLYFGTSGDPVSGGWKILPHEYGEIAELAKAMMKAYYHEYTTPQVQFMSIFTDYPAEKLSAKFADSFHGGRDIVAAFLVNFYREGNFRRVRMFMQGAYLYSAPVHFFHDKRIYDYYSRLPYRALMGQKVHNRLCYLACPAMAFLPATNFPVPVALEPALLPLAKRLVSSRLRTRLRPMTRRSALVKPRLEPFVRECLDGHGAAVGIKLELLESIMEREGRAGVLALRARYVANMLEPDGLLAKSRLIGEKKVTVA